MLTTKRIADVVFDEFARAGISVDFTMLCYVMDMMSWIRVPDDEAAWRRMVCDQLCVFYETEIEAVVIQLE